MILDYIKSLVGNGPKNHRADSVFFLILGAVFAGYTATNIHVDFLKNFENPFIQLVVFYAIGISSYGGKKPPGSWGIGGWKVIWAGPYVFFDALFAVIIFQFLSYISNSYYNVPITEKDLTNETVE